MSDASERSRADPALEVLPGAAAILDDEGVVVAANDRWRERGDAAGLAHPPVGEPFPGEAAPAVAGAVRTVLDGERDAVERRHPGAELAVAVRAFEGEDGRRAVVTTVAAPGEWPGGAAGVLDAAGDPVAVYDPAADRVHVNDATAELLGLDRRSLPVDGPAIERALGRASEDSVAAFREAIDAVLAGEAGTRRVELELDPATGPPMALQVRLGPLPLGGDEGVVVVGRDVTEFRGELRELAQLRDARETLVRVTTVVQNLIGELVGETRRSDIEAAVVEELTRSEPYRFAVVGRYDPARESLVEHAAAGVDDATARAIGTVLLAEHAALLRTGDVQVVELDDPDLPAAVGRDAVVVPLTYGNAVYGLLCVGLGRAGLTDRELSAFEVLGAVVGFAINAAKHRRLVLTDLVTELAFEVDGGGVLAGLSAAADAELRVESVVPGAEGTQLQYLRVEDGDPGVVAAAAEELDGVRAVRRLADAPDGAALELTVAGASVPLAVGERGGTVETAEAADGVVRVTAVVAAEENVRELVEHARTAVPAAELVGKRDVERAPEPAGVPAGAVESLTDRQRAALETAYRSGYFEHPRDSTAEEVADALNVASPTLHQHLQAAHRKLLDGVFDEDA